MKVVAKFQTTDNDFTTPAPSWYSDGQERQKLSKPAPNAGNVARGPHLAENLADARIDGHICGWGSMPPKMEPFLAAAITTVWRECVAPETIHLNMARKQMHLVSQAKMEVAEPAPAAPSLKKIESNLPWFAGLICEVDKHFHEFF